MPSHHRLFRLSRSPRTETPGEGETSAPGRDETRRRGHGGRRHAAWPLGELARSVDQLQLVHKRDLRSGDWVVVTTRNSVYSLLALEDGSYSVAGGWFDRQQRSPERVGVNGCTFGGQAIKHDVLAGPGLFLEFANQVTTTRIQKVQVFYGDDRAALH